MKIKSKLFTDYVKKASLNGEFLIINMDFTEDGLRSAVKNPGDIVMTMTSLDKSAFKEYKSIGEIFVKSTPTFLKYLKSFNDEITIEKVEEFTIRLSDEKREIFVILASESICGDIVIKQDAPVVPTTAKIFFDSGFIKRTIDDVNLLKISQIILKKTEKEFFFEVGEKTESDFFVNKVDFDPIRSKGVGEVTIGQTFVSLFNALDTVVEFNIGQNLPLVAKEVEGPLSFTCFIAPIAYK